MAICMRTPSKRPTKNYGYIHILTDPRTPMELIDTKTEPESPAVNWDTMASISHAALMALPNRVEELVQKWGLSGMDSLNTLRAGRIITARAYSFPMCDGYENTIGIHLRGDNGAKFCIKGSKLGLFIPRFSGLKVGGPLYICEGASDTAVLLDRGFHAVGRPSNIGATDLIVNYCKYRKINEVVLICDRDKPGTPAAAATERGKRTLIASLRAMRIRYVKCIRPPGCNDVKEWSPSREVIQTVTNSAEVMK